MTIYNWDRVPPEYNWVATDKSGEIKAYSEKPRRGISRWEVVGGFYQGLGSIPSCLAEGDSTFWEISLEERPKPKPRYRATRSEYPEPTVMYDRLTKKYLTIYEVEHRLNDYELSRNLKGESE